MELFRSNQSRVLVSLFIACPLRLLWLPRTNLTVGFPRRKYLACSSTLAQTDSPTPKEICIVVRIYPIDSFRPVETVDWTSNLAPSLSCPKLRLLGCATSEVPRWERALAKPIKMMGSSVWAQSRIVMPLGFQRVNNLRLAGSIAALVELSHWPIVLPAEPGPIQRVQHSLVARLSGNLGLRDYGLAMAVSLWPLLLDNNLRLHCGAHNYFLLWAASCLVSGRRSAAKSAQGSTGGNVEWLSTAPLAVHFRFHARHPAAVVVRRREREREREREKQQRGSTVRESGTLQQLGLAWPNFGNSLCALANANVMALVERQAKIM